MSLRFVKSPAAPKITITQGLAGSPAFRSAGLPSGSRDIDRIPLSTWLHKAREARVIRHEGFHTCFSPTKQARNTTAANLA
jgi:hypothetical protein